MKVNLGIGEVKTAKNSTKLKLLTSQLDTVLKKTGGKKSRVRIATPNVRHKGKLQSRQSK